MKTLSMENAKGLGFVAPYEKCVQKKVQHYEERKISQ